MEILRFKINHKTPIKKVWDMIRKISGTTKTLSYNHSNHASAETKSTSKTDIAIADTLGETFANNSSKQITLKIFEKSTMNKRKLNSISSLRILKRIANFLILMNFWKQLINHMILQLDMMKYIIK